MIVGLVPDPFDLAFVVVERQIYAGDIRQVGGDIRIPDRYPALLHVVGVHEQDIIDHIQVFKKNGTDKTVKIASRYQSVFLTFRH